MRTHFEISNNTYFNLKCFVLHIGLSIYFANNLINVTNLNICAHVSYISHYIKNVRSCIEYCSIHQPNTKEFMWKWIKWLGIWHITLQFWRAPSATNHIKEIVSAIQFHHALDINISAAWKRNSIYPLKGLSGNRLCCKKYVRWKATAMEIGGSLKISFE